MKKILSITILLLSGIIFGQIEKHNWKPLTINDSIKIWYDLSQLDTVKSVKFQIWLLELHKPAIEFEGVNGKIMRTKTLYLINLDNFRYAIKEIAYYNPANIEIKRFKYDLEKYTDQFKYSFPILKNSIFEKLIKELQRLIEQKKTQKK